MGWRAGTKVAGRTGRMLIGVEDGGDDDGGEVQDDASAARRAASFVIGTWRRGRGCSSLGRKIRSPSGRLLMYP